MWLSWGCSDYWLAGSLSNSRLIYRNDKNKSNTKKGGRQKGPSSENESRSALWAWTPSARSRDPSNPEWVEEEDWGGREVGSSGKVTRVVANLTVGPDGCGGWAIYVRWGGAAQEGALTVCERQGSPRRNSSRLGRWRSPQKYWLGTVAFHEITINFRKAQTF